MGRTVTFTIKGDAAHAIAALGSIEKKLDRIAQHQAFANLNRHLNASTAVIRRMDRQFRGLNQAFRQLSTGATQFQRSFRGLSQGGVRVNQTLRNTVNINNRVTTSIRNAAQRQQQQARAVRRTNEAYLVLLGTMKRVQNIARGVNQAATAFRGASSQIAGGIQSGAIATRMSGIALGNQLAQVAAAPLAGNILSPVLEILRQTLVQGSGILTIAAEAGVRIVTGIGGAIAKTIGPIVGGAVQIGLTAIGAVFSGGGGFGSTVFSTLALLGNAVQNAFIGITNIAGEMVTQLGNVFVGISEAVRGAFQAAVNIAGQILNQLVTVAEQVVGEVAGILGKIGKAVLGTAGAITGLSIREIVKTEGTLTEALILLDPKVTPAQKESLREWAFNMRREVAQLGANAPGEALEMFVSTGFQARPEQAAEFATQALRLAQATGEQNAKDIARAMAKGYNLFGGEIDMAAKNLGTNPAELLADAFFNLRNYSDLTMSEIANRFSEVLGIGKQFKLTFEEIAATTATTSLALGPEQTFTGVQQLFESFRKLRDDGANILNREGIIFKDLTATEKERLAVLQQQRDALADQAGLGDRLKDRIKDLTLAKQGSTNKSEKAAIGREIHNLRVQLRGVEKAGASAELEAIDDEIGRIGAKGGFLTNVLSTLDQIEAKIRSGEISQFEARDIIPNIRALRAAAARLALSPELRQEVAEGTRFDRAQGATSRAGETRELELGFKFKRIFKEITEPVTAFFNQNRDVILGFFDATIAKLVEFNDKWLEIITNPASDKFFSDLQDRLGLEGLSLDLSSIDPENFWAGLTAAVDWVETAGEKVITFFTTLYDLIMKAAEGSKALAAVWDVLSAAGSTVGGIIEGMAGGDTSNLEAFAQSVTDLWTDIKQTTLNIVANLAGVLAKVVGVIGDVMTSVQDGLASVPGLKTILGTTGGYALANSLVRQGVGPSVGGAASAVTPAGAAVVGSGLSQFAGRAGTGFARSFGPLAAAGSIYSHATTDAEDVTSLGTGLRALGAGTAGFAIGGPVGGLIGIGVSLVIDGGKALHAALTSAADDISSVQIQGRDLIGLTGGIGGETQVPYLREAIAAAPSPNLQEAAEYVARQIELGSPDSYIDAAGGTQWLSELPEHMREVGRIVSQMQRVAVSDAPPAVKEQQLALLDFMRRQAEAVARETEARREATQAAKEEAAARQANILALVQAEGTAGLVGSRAYGSSQARAAQEAESLQSTIRQEGRDPTAQERRRLDTLERRASAVPSAAQTRRRLEEQSRAALAGLTTETPEVVSRTQEGAATQQLRSVADRRADFEDQRRSIGSYSGPYRDDEGAPDRRLRLGLEAAPFDPEGRFYANQGTPAETPSGPQISTSFPDPQFPIVQTGGPGGFGAPGTLPFGMTEAEYAELNRTQREQLSLLASGQTERLTNRAGLPGIQSITGEFDPLSKLASDPFGAQSPSGQFGFTTGGLGTRLEDNDTRPSLGGIGGLISGRALRDRGVSGFGGFTGGHVDPFFRKLQQGESRVAGQYGTVQGEDYDKYLNDYFKQREKEAQELGIAPAASGVESTDGTQPIVSALDKVAEAVGDPGVTEKIQAAAEGLQAAADASAQRAREAAESAAANIQSSGDSLKQGMNGLSSAVGDMGQTTVGVLDSLREQISSLTAEVESLKAQAANSGG